MIGQTIGNFRIVTQLGAGGMGEVFLAEQPNIHTKVAIKVLRSDISRDKDHVQRFFNEANAVGKIKHSGTVKIFEGGFLPTGSAYLVMELLEGETLSSRIARSGRLPVASICDVGRQVASILGATHAVGITHRDLKPDNIFIVPDVELASGERVKILDFGIAKLTGTLVAGKPRTVGTMGTPAYMAPEQWGDSGSVDWRADAYSLGCVLFEMAGGRPPFTGASFADLCMQHLSTPPPSPRDLGVVLPPALEAVIMRLLAKDPAKRADSMGALGKELEAIGRDAPVPGDATVRPLVAPHPVPDTTMRGAAGERRGGDPRRTGVLVVAVTGAVVLGGGLLGSKLFDRPAATPDAATPVAEPAQVETPPPPVEAPPSLAERIAAANPYVTVHGVTVMKHQVTGRELAMYLETLPPERRAAAGPVFPVSGEGALVGMSWNRADRFCKAIGASLPTDEQWRAAAAGGWGIDAGEGPGPLREWTSTIVDGLVMVRGAHSAMGDADKQEEILREPLLKAQETSPDDPPAAIADERIGFRCVK